MVGSADQQEIEVDLPLKVGNVRVQRALAREGETLFIPGQQRGEGGALGKEQGDIFEPLPFDLQQRQGGLLGIAQMGRHLRVQLQARQPIGRHSRAQGRGDNEQEEANRQLRRVRLKESSQARTEVHGYTLPMTLQYVKF
jgi:hypothetical protein